MSELLKDEIPTNTPLETKETDQQNNDIALEENPIPTIDEFRDQFAVILRIRL